MRRVASSVRALSGIALFALACKGEPVAPDPNEDTDLRLDAVECNGETCDLLEGEICCFKGTKRDGCAMDCDGSEMHCDGPEDCPEDAPICCGDDTDQTECRSSCDRPVCHDHNDCAEFESVTKCYASAFVELNFCKTP